MPSAPRVPNLSGYTLRRHLGSGIGGTVYLATQLDLDRDVAVKVFTGVEEEQAGAQERFRREAQLMGEFPHPCVVPLYDVQLDADPPYLVMAHLSGGDLWSRVRGHPLAPAELFALARRLAAGLAHLHNHGIIHRDLKPANVLYDDQDDAYLGDLGLALTSTSTRLTREGHVVGTPLYMAPELYLGEGSDPPADIYSLGLVLLAAATGSHPQAFPASIPEHDYAALRPAGLEGMVRIMTRHDPEERTLDARTLTDELQAMELPTIPPTGAAGDDPTLTATLSTQPPLLTAPTAPTLSRKTSLPAVASGAALACMVIGFVQFMAASAPDPAPPLAASALLPVSTDDAPERRETASSDFPAEAWFLNARAEHQRSLNLSFFRGEVVETALLSESDLRRAPPMLEANERTWGAVLEASPVMRGFFEWSAAGGRAWELAPDLCKKLAALDGAYVATGAFPPFQSHLEFQSDRTPSQLQAAPVARAHLELKILLEAYQEVNRVASEARSQNAAINFHGHALPALPHRYWSQNPATLEYLDALRAAALKHASVRDQNRHWIAPLFGQFQRTLIAADQASRSPDSDFPGLVVAMIEAKFLYDLGWSQWSSLPPRLLPGIGAKTPAGQVFRHWIQHRALNRYRRFTRADPLARRRVLDELRELRVHRPSLGSGPIVTDRLTGWILVWEATRLGDPSEEVPPEFVVERCGEISAQLSALPEDLGFLAAQFLAAVLVRHFHPSPRGLAGRLIPFLEASLTSSARPSRWTPEPGQVRRRIRELEELASSN